MTRPIHPNANPATGAGHHMWDKLDNECGSGWDLLIDPILTMCDVLGLEVLQVKEKFGGVRVYFTPYYNRDVSDARCTPADEAILEEMIEAAETASFKTCEICGGPGRLTNSKGWLMTRCLDHEEPGSIEVEQIETIRV